MPQKVRKSEVEREEQFPNERNNPSIKMAWLGMTKIIQDKGRKINGDTKEKLKEGRKDEKRTGEEILGSL